MDSPEPTPAGSPARWSPWRPDAFAFGASALAGAAAVAALLYFALRAGEAALQVGSPFVTAAVIALLLDPVVNRFEKKAAFFTKGRRSRAVVLAFGLFLASFGAVLVWVIPNLVQQTQNVIAWVGDEGPAKLQRAIDDWLREHRSIGPLQLPASLQEIGSRYSEQISGALKSSSSRVADLIVGSLTRLFSTLLVPIVTFYLLMDLDRLRARLLFLLPERARNAFVTTSRDVSTVFGSYIRGMVQVSLAYMVVATVILFALSFVFPAMRSYVLLIGVVGGLFYVVPYIGFLAVVLLTIVVGIVTGAGTAAIGSFVFALFVLNTAFDNIVTPRIVGGGVGLHPLVAMFALLLGAATAGLWGMLLAVPFAGSVQVVLKRLFPKLAAPTAPVLVGRMRDEAEAAEGDGDALTAGE
ncbi:MAG: AI-2E family transporter [Armatimonadota bacterium]